jgi:hypothetical protein
MMRTWLALVASLPLFVGCATKTIVLPNPSIPHRVAKETTATIWVRLPSGQLAKAKVRVMPGWWLASPEVVESYPTAP